MAEIGMQRRRKTGHAQAGENHAKQHHPEAIATADEHQTECVQQQPDLQDSAIAVAVRNAAEDGGKDAHGRPYPHQTAKDNHIDAQSVAEDLQIWIEHLDASIDQQLARDARADQACEAELTLRLGLLNGCHVAIDSMGVGWTIGGT